MQAVTSPRPGLGTYPGVVGYPLSAAISAFITWYVWALNGLGNPFVEVMILLTAMFVTGAVITVPRYFLYGVTAESNENGVTLNGRELRYDAIDSVALTEKARLGLKARTIATRRTLTVAAGGKRRTYLWMAGKDDPLAPIVTTLLDRMAKEAQRRPLRGAGWSLELSNLHARDGAVTPLGTIAAAAVYNDEVRLWRGGEIAPFLTIDKTTPNAFVLLRVGRRAATGAPADGAFGRHLFTRRTSGVVNVLAAFGSGFFAAMCVVGFAAYRTQLLLGCAALTVILVLRALLTFFRRYRFYEHGLVAGGRELRYDEIERMTWKDTRNFHNAAYLGTTVKIELTPAAGRAVHLKLYHLSTVDADLNRVRKTITAAIDERHERARAPVVAVGAKGV